MKRRYIYTALTMVALGLALFLVGDDMKVPSHTGGVGITSSSTLPATTSVEWVSLVNTEYGYSLSRPKYLAVLTDSTVEESQGTSSVVTTVTEPSISLVRMGKEDVGTFQLKVLNKEIVDRNPKGVRENYRSNYMLDLSTFAAAAHRDAQQHKDANIVTEVTPLEEVKVAGKMGYMYTSSSTYVGTEPAYEFAPRAYPYKHLFFEHRGNKIVIVFLDESKISHEILSTFRFE